MSELTVQVTDLPGVVLMVVAGDVKTDVSVIDRQMTRLLARRPASVVIDVTAVPFCSSLGMGCFVALQRDMARCGCKVKLVGLQPFVREAFQRAFVLQMFELHTTLAEAIGQPLPASNQVS